MCFSQGGGGVRTCYDMVELGKSHPYFSWIGPMNIFVFLSVDTHQPTALCVIRKAYTVTMHQLCPLPGLQFAHQFNWEFLIACRWVWMVVCVSVRPLRWTGILSRLQLCLRPETAGIGCGTPVTLSAESGGFLPRRQLFPPDSAFPFPASSSSSSASSAWSGAPAPCLARLTHLVY